MAAAIAVHFIVPAYGLVLVADAALGHAPGTLAGWCPTRWRWAGAVLAYCGLSALATGAAWVMDRAIPPAPKAQALTLAPLIARERALGRRDGRLAGASWRPRAARPDGLGADVALLLDAAGAARGAQAPRPN
jgi:hypothetical protein